MEQMIFVNLPVKDLEVSKAFFTKLGYSINAQFTDENASSIVISDTIVVRCAAFRVVGTSPGTGTPRTAAEIAALFLEGGPQGLTVPWTAARIAFELVQPVGVVTTDDARANIWPQSDDDAAQSAQDTAFATANGVSGVLNLFFFKQMETSTAYAWMATSSEAEAMAMAIAMAPTTQIASGCRPTPASTSPSAASAI